MTTKYPNQVDGLAELPLAIDNITQVKAEAVNNLREAILAIESELGADPSREYGTVRARLDAISAQLDAVSQSGGSGGSGSSVALVLPTEPSIPVSPAANQGVLWLRDDNILIFTDQNNNSFDVLSGSESLAATLALGNLTGGTNIVVSAGDSIQGNTDLTLTPGILLPGSKIILDGYTDILGNLAITGSLSANGHTELLNGLSVLGTSNLDGYVNITNDAAITGTLSVNGHTELLNSVSITGNTEIDGYLDVLNNLAITGTLAVNGHTEILNSLSVLGTVELQNNLTVDGYTDLLGNLSVNGTLSVNGYTEILNNISVLGNTVLDGYELVMGSIATFGNLSANGRTTLLNGLSVLGSSTFDGYVDILNDTAITGTLAVNGHTEILNTLSVLGDAEFDGYLSSSNISFRSVSSAPYYNSIWTKNTSPTTFFFTDSLGNDLTFLALGAAGGVINVGSVSQQTVPGVSATPGWTVVGGFYLDPATPGTTLTLECIALVSTASLTGNLRLYDITAGGAVSGSTLTIGAATTDTRVISSNLKSVMTTGRIYQFQAECTGGNTVNDYIVVRSMKLIPN